MSSHNVYTQLELPLGHITQPPETPEPSKRKKKEACSFCVGYMQHFLMTHGRHKNNRDRYVDSRPRVT
jgi:hypothetical protein